MAGVDVKAPATRSCDGDWKGVASGGARSSGGDGVRSCIGGGVSSDGGG